MICTFKKIGGFAADSFQKLFLGVAGFYSEGVMEMSGFKKNYAEKNPLLELVTFTFGDVGVVFCSFFYVLC